MSMGDMPRFDYLCEHCRHVEERRDIDGADPCPICHAGMVRQPAAPSFTIKGYSAKNGYSRG